MWQLNIVYDGEPVELFADEVDFTHFPLVYIRKIRKEARSGIVVVPETEIYKKLVQFKQVILPVSNLQFAGEIDEGHRPTVTPFLKGIDEIAADIPSS